MLVDFISVESVSLIYGLLKLSFIVLFYKFYIDLYIDESSNFVKFMYLFYY
jgi:hypothetical protein